MPPHATDAATSTKQAAGDQPVAEDAEKSPLIAPTTESSAASMSESAAAAGGAPSAVEVEAAKKKKKQGHNWVSSSNSFVLQIFLYMILL